MTTIKLKNGSGAPTAGDLAQGEPALDLTNKRLYTEDSGGTVIEVGTNPGVDVTFADNRKAIFGTGSDLQIYHDGSNSYIDENGVGNLFIRSVNGASARIYSGGTASSNLRLLANSGGEITLYHSGSAKLATTSTGIGITGNATFDDNGKAIFGAGSDLQIFHNGSNSYIQEVGTGNLIIQADEFLVQNAAGNANYIRCQSSDESVQLRHGGATKFQTTSTGIDVTGNLTVDAGSNGKIEFGNITTNYGRLYADNTGTFVGSVTADPLIFRTTNAERMRITTSGSVEIKGNSGSLSHRFDYNENGGEIQLLDETGAVGTLIDQASNNTRVLELINGSNLQLGLGGSNTTGDIIFMAAGLDEAARFDASGNFLVGQSSAGVGTVGGTMYADGTGKFTVDGSIVSYFNRLTSDGTILSLRKDTTEVGSIGTFATDLTIGKAGAGLRFEDGTVSIRPHNISTNAGSDDAVNLGWSDTRFDNIYATNGTIQTSDRNEKQDIEELSDAEQRVAVAAKGLLRKYRWVSRVETKGDDARIHFGIIAQDLQDAFTAEGLDAGRYGMFINSTWTDEETGEERSRMGVRYSELLAFIISAI